MDLMYRLWDKKQKFFQPEMALSIAGNGHIWFGDKKAEDDRFIVSLCSGKEDDNDKKIYEEDFLKVSRLRCKSNDPVEKGKDLIFIGTVIWNAEECSFDFYYEFPDGGACSLGLNFDDDRFEEVLLEVVGNSFENSLVLKNGVWIVK